MAKAETWDTAWLAALSLALRLLGWPMCPMATFLVVTCSSSSTHTAQLPKLGASARTAFEHESKQSAKDVLAVQKEMKQRQKPWYLAGTNLQTPIFSWFPRLELKEKVTICQETLQISPCKRQAHTRSSLGKKRDIFDLLDGCFQGNWGPKLVVALAVLLRHYWKVQNKHE